MIFFSHLKTIVIFFCCLLFISNTDAQNRPVYVSPSPGSINNSRETNIILSFGRTLKQSSIKPEYVLIYGTRSGVIPVAAVLSDDATTVILQPQKKYVEGETIRVHYKGGFHSQADKAIDPYEFNFSVTPLKKPIPLTSEMKKVFHEEGENQYPLGSMAGGTKGNDSLPADLPAIQVTALRNPSPGYIFMSTSNDAPGTGYYNYILDSKGNYAKYMKVFGHYPNNFQTQPNGLLSYNYPYDTYEYAGGGHSIVRILDTAFQQVDSFQCGNGYLSDSHEFLLLPNGHAIMVAYDMQPIDMSTIVAGGNPGALVLGSIIQELDQQKRVVFQWRSWDTIPITDTYQNMKLPGFDYIHVNAVRVDYDGNILIMSRLLCEITKINRKTGEIMWRMGGKKNQFTFLNEHPELAPTYFTHPHSLTVLKNGNFLFFDNGLLHSPQFSRAVEYKINEINKTAELVWEYRNTPDIYAATQGSTQRLDNGNTFIGWGSASLTGKPAVTEVTHDKQIVFEAKLPLNNLSYRALKYPFRESKAEGEVSKEDLQSGVLYQFDNDGGKTGVGILFQQLTGGYNYLNVKRYSAPPKNMVFSGSTPMVLPLRFTIFQIGIATMSAEVTLDSMYTGYPVQPASLRVYKRNYEGQGIFVPLPTVYNPQTGKISFTTTSFGEFILGIEQLVSVPPVPITFAPKMNEPVNMEKPVIFGFSGKGMTSGYHLQISIDSSFSVFAVNDSLLVSGRFELVNPLPNIRYFWRVRAKNSLGWGNWSMPQRFETKPPFIIVISPNGGEKFVKRSTYFISWKYNVSEKVSLQLYRGNQFSSSVSDSANNSGGFQWTVPDSLVSDSNYTLRIVSFPRGETEDYSDMSFTISNVTSLAETTPIPLRHNLSEAFPNPFNPETGIVYSIAEKSNAELMIFDVTGRLVKTLVSAEHAAGIYSVKWKGVNEEGMQVGSGMYFMRLRLSGAGSMENHFEVTKKLLLLK